MKRFVQNGCFVLAILGLSARATLSGEIQTGEMAGYLIIPNKRVPDSYNGGFSMYVAAWPLLQNYPGQRFQSGLPGTWMFAQPVDGPVKDLYSDIEGGLGWWRDTEYATETPKFIMGGVAPNFSEWANGPGAGMNRDWSQSFGKYGVAQLSPWLLWPPDGLNLAQGTRGELLGYGYLPLPLTNAKQRTAGQELPTGDQCWTLFLNAANFKGPVAFFTPYFWSKAALEEERFRGQLLDSRPSDPNRALQMETQYIPSVQAVDSQGVSYVRIVPVQFPCDEQGQSVLVHQVTSYQRAAMWEPMNAWLTKDVPFDGRIETQHAVVHQFGEGGYATWQIYADGTEAKEDKLKVGWDRFASPVIFPQDAYGYRWAEPLVRKSDTDERSLIVLPEYYRLQKDAENRSEWIPIAAAEVPAETGLRQEVFVQPPQRTPSTYATPDEPSSCWKNPGPQSGPHYVDLGDGSRLTYYWYRFADQPTLLNADLTAEERETLQAKVERLHAAWLPDRDYLPPPRTGELAGLDPALVVTPPAGMETGYVPIVTRQEPSPNRAER